MCWSKPIPVYALSLVSEPQYTQLCIRQANAINNSVCPPKPMASHAYVKLSLVRTESQVIFSDGSFSTSKWSMAKHIRICLVQILTKVQKSVYGMRKMPSSGNLLYDTLYLGQDLVTIVPRDIAWKFNLEDVLRKTKRRFFVALQSSNECRVIVRRWHQIITSNTNWVCLRDLLKLLSLSSYYCRRSNAENKTRNLRYSNATKKA